MRAALLTLLLCLPAAPAAAAGSLEFNRDVRPILSDNCFACHGPDTNKIKGGLRLDSREAALKGGKSGDPALVPGKPDKSPLIARVTTHDRDELMPPPESHKNLTSNQIAIIRRWIAEGAEYQGHWAFLPPNRPALPPIPAGGNAIDALLAPGMASRGLVPNRDADRLTLLRRAALDLTGLPPTEADREAFLNDASPEAWSRAIDRLLASPHYGETMAIQWLDFARYADSNGFQSDTHRTMWPWRDWVIRAFNENKPFDRFTIEQLAGDLLPGATPDQIVATGFHRNHRLNGEGGRIVEEWFAENVIDRVETTGLTWLALTLNCCRCHDHKYDPISQKEFYSLFAYFNSIDESGVLGEFGGAGSTRKGGNTDPVLRLPTAEEQRTISQTAAALDSAQTALAALPASQPELLDAWIQRQRAAFAAGGVYWTAPVAEKAEAEKNAELNRLEDGTWLVSGGTSEKETYRLEWPPPPGPLTGVQLEVFPHDSLPNKSLGRSVDGNFVLSAIEVHVIGPDGEKTPVALTSAEADYEQPGWSIAGLVHPSGESGGPAPDGRRAGWAIGGNLAGNRVPRKALFKLAPTTVPAGSRLRVVMRHEALADHSIGRFRLSTSAQPPRLLTLQSDASAEAAKRLLATAPKELPADLRQELEKLFVGSPENPRQRAAGLVAQARKAHEAALAAPVSVMVMREKDEPRDAFVLLRGEYDKIGPRASRELPRVLPPLPPGAPNNRLGFAQWLVSGRHPLTARVWVNRAWERFFGVGLVKTSENFGSQAEWPSNPELLDWLATEFVRLEWDMKAMQKTILMSNAYRRSADLTPEMLEKDPENRLLARGARFRLPAETIRDQALAVSGLLVPKIGGPSVRPYMPEAVWDETSVYGDMRNYKADAGDGLFRRSIYTVWKRTAAPPSMLMFDSASREVCTVKRSRSNTPTQALSLLNETTYIEAARKLAENTLRQPGNTDSRLGWAFQRVTARSAKPSELQILRAGLERRLTAYAAAPEGARKLVSNGASPVPKDLPTAELAAWTVTCNVLLNLDETVTRE